MQEVTMAHTTLSQNLFNEKQVNSFSDIFENLGDSLKHIQALSYSKPD